MIALRKSYFLLVATLIFGMHGLMGHGHGCGYSGGGSRSVSRGYSGHRSAGARAPWTENDTQFVLFMICCGVFICLCGLCGKLYMHSYYDALGEITQNIVPGNTGRVRIHGGRTLPAQSKCTGASCSILFAGTAVKVVSAGWYYVIVERADGKQDH